MKKLWCLIFHKKKNYDGVRISCLKCNRWWELIWKFGDEEKHGYFHWEEYDPKEQGLME